MAITGCAVLGAGCGEWEAINSWRVELPEGVEKPPVEVPAPPPPGSPTKKILQLTDIHLDLRYSSDPDPFFQCAQWDPWIQLFYHSSTTQRYSVYFCRYCLQDEYKYNLSF